MPDHNETPFKKILDFHEQTLGQSNHEKKLIAQKQSIDFNEYERRIIGKEKELEFFIIMKAVSSFKTVEPIDENLSQISGEKTPDYEVEFKDGYKMMIEVKHTNQNEYKISGGNLQKRIDYATKNNLPLRFAISIQGFWGLFTSDFIKSKAGKINLLDFWIKGRNSWFDRELETCAYMFRRPLKIISVYSNNTTDGLGVYYKSYGELISYELYYAERLILRVERNDDSKCLHMFILEIIQDKLSNSFQEITTNGNLTTIVEHNESSPCKIFPEYLFIMAIIKHMRYTNKNSKDNVFLVANEEGGHFLPIEYIRLVMSDLFDLGVEITCFKDGLGYSFDDYRTLFWTK